MIFLFELLKVRKFHTNSSRHGLDGSCTQISIKKNSTCVPKT